MSSTNRSEARKEHIADYYVTTISDIQMFLDEFKKIDGVTKKFQNGIIVDPCSGGNNEIKDSHGIREVAHLMSYPEALNKCFGENTELDIRTYDVRQDSLAENKCNYLTTKLDYTPNVIISNPPFKYGIDFIKKALDDVADDGYVIMLLRLNFFGSKERKVFFDEYMPEYCFVHHRRISFTEKKNDKGYIEFNASNQPKKGSTDSIEYCHMVWRKGYTPDCTKLYIV